MKSVSKVIGHCSSNKAWNTGKPAPENSHQEKQQGLPPSNNFLQWNLPDASVVRNSNQAALRTSKPFRIQTKLKTDTPGDSLEQEADLVADQILQMADPHDAPPNKASQPSLATPSIQRKVTQSKGNSTIASPEVKNALNSPGQALDSQTRSYFEPRFKRDFSRVRIHTDQNAENATDSIQAKAFTHGRNIVFGKNQYAPSSAPGRRLLAHELTHVVQQDRAPQPTIQRKKKAPDPEKMEDNRLDSLTSSIVSLGLGNQGSWDPKTLISFAQSTFEGYENTDPVTMPRSLGSRAMLLLEIFENLEIKSEETERGLEGELLLGDEVPSFSVLGNPEDPWTPSKPKAVTDIPPFNDEVILEELHQAASHEMLLRAVEKQMAKSKRGRSSSKKSRGKPPAVRPGAVTLPPLSVTGKAPPKKRSLGSGTGKISQSLKLLRSTKLKDVWDSKKGTPTKPYDTGSLMSHVDEIWYLGNRLYKLDKTGHVKSSTGSAIRLNRAGADPGGTYFMIPTNSPSARKHNIFFDAFRVDGASTRKGIGVDPSTVRDLLDLMQTAQKTFKRKKAIAVIAGKPGKKTEGFSEGMKKFGRAVDRIPNYIMWALKKEIKRRIDDPMSIVSDIALDVVINKASKYVPQVGLALAGYQLLELSAWLGDTANIAVYARTDDELSISAQIFALRIAEEAVGEAISAGAGRMTRGLGSPKSSSPSKGSGPDVDAPDAPTVKDIDPPTSKDAPEVRTPEPKTPDPEIKPPVKPEAPAPKAPTPSPRKRPVPPPVATPAKPHPQTPPPAPKKPTPKTPDPAPSATQPKQPANTSPPAPTPTPKPAIPAKPRETVGRGEVVSTDGSGIKTNDPDLRKRLTQDQQESLDRLKDAYEQYKKREEENLAKGRRKIPVLDAEGWLKAQKGGQSKQDAINVMGPDFAKTPKKKKPTAKDIDIHKDKQPSTYKDSQRDADINKLESEPNRLWERLSEVRKALAGRKKISASVMNILKGNIGEILALPILRKELADIKKTNPDAELYEGVRVAQIKPDGSYDTPRLFSDGLIGEINNGVLKIFKVFETKSGSKGGAEARSQFFDWREGRFNDGDKIIMTDPKTGKKVEFIYDPTKKGKGRATNVMGSTPVVIVTSDALKTGSGTSQNVGQNVQLESLGISSDAIDFLALKILQREAARQAQQASQNNSNSSPP